MYLSYDILCSMFYDGFDHLLFMILAREFLPWAYGEGETHDTWHWTDDSGLLATCPGGLREQDSAYYVPQDV